MKKTIAIITTSLAIASSAYAANSIGQCVYPKTKIQKNGNLSLAKEIQLYEKPLAEAPKQKLSTLSAFKVSAEANGYIQLTTVPDYSKPAPEEGAGKIIGWAKHADFDLQDPRNCN